VLPRRSAPAGMPDRQAVESGRKRSKAPLTGKTQRMDRRAECAPAACHCPSAASAGPAASQVSARGNARPDAANGQASECAPAACHCPSAASAEPAASQRRERRTCCLAAPRGPDLLPRRSAPAGMPDQTQRMDGRASAPSRRVIVPAQLQPHLHSALPPAPQRRLSSCLLAALCWSRRAVDGKAQDVACEALGLIVRLPRRQG
jgi:hypothetical protein